MTKLDISRPLNVYNKTKLFLDNTKIRFSKEGFKQTMETAEEISNMFEDILETVYDNKTSVSSNL